MQTSWLWSEAFLKDLQKPLSSGKSRTVNLALARRGEPGPWGFVTFLSTAKSKLAQSRAPLASLYQQWTSSFAPKWQKWHNIDLFPDKWWSRLNKHLTSCPNSICLQILCRSGLRLSIPELSSLHAMSKSKQTTDTINLPSSIQVEDRGREQLTLV